LAACVASAFCACDKVGTVHRKQATASRVAILVDRAQSDTFFIVSNLTVMKDTGTNVPVYSLGGTALGGKIIQPLNGDAI
jgi:hypothetical protein